MSISLPRLNNRVPIGDQSGRPAITFSRQWDQICSVIENGIPGAQGPQGPQGAPGPAGSPGSGSPGGSNGQVQYNSAGVFGGLTNAQLTAYINTFTSSLSGAVPASGGGTANFLRADGVFAAVSGLASLVDFESFGAVGDGVTDDSGAINSAIAWSAANSEPVYARSNVYACASAIHAVSGATVWCFPGATLLRTFNSSGSSGLLSQSNTSVKITNFSWTGGRFTTAPFAITTGDTLATSNVIHNVASFTNIADGDFIAGQQVGAANTIPSGTQISSHNVGAQTITMSNPASATLVGGSIECCHWGGNIIGIYGDDITLANVIIDTFANGRAIAARGDNWTIINPLVTNPLPVTGVGGIRCTGGSDFRCVGGFVTAGDDALQFTTTPAGNDSTFGGYYIGVVGYSLSAHLFVVGLADPGNGQTLTASIKSCGFIGCSGFGSGGRGGVIHNLNSSGVIQDILIAGMTLMGDPNNTIAMTINGADISGAACQVQDINIVDCTIIAPNNNGLQVSGHVANVSFSGVIEAPTASGNPPIFLKGLQGGRFRGHFYGGAAADVAHLVNDVSTGRDCFNVDFSGSTFDTIDNGNYGLNLTNATNCGAGFGAVFIPKTGGTTANSTNLSGTATHCYLIGADVSQMSAQGGGGYASLNVAGGQGHIVNSLYGDSTNAGAIIQPPVIYNDNLDHILVPTAGLTPVLDKGALSADKKRTLKSTNAVDGMQVLISRNGSSGGHNGNALQNDGVTLIKAIADNFAGLFVYSTTLSAWYLASYAPCS